MSNTLTSTSALPAKSAIAVDTGQQKRSPWPCDPYNALRLSFGHAFPLEFEHHFRSNWAIAASKFMCSRPSADPPAYIARQLGHASTAMLFKHYAKWIDGARTRAQALVPLKNAGHHAITDAPLERHIIGIMR